MYLSRFVHRLDIIGEESARLERGGVPVIVPLFAAHPIGGVRKSGHRFVRFVEDRSAAAMVEMQMSENDIRHFVRRISDAAYFLADVFHLVQPVIF